MGFPLDVVKISCLAPIEAIRSSWVGSLHETYMLFGGDAQQHRNSITHVIAAGLPILNARAISDIYPDFYMCKSPGAKRTCISVTGAPIRLKSVHIVQNDADITRDVAPSLKETKLVLAQSVQIQDCQPLLR